MQTEPDITNGTSYSIIMTKRATSSHIKELTVLYPIQDIKMEPDSLKP